MVAISTKQDGTNSRQEKVLLVLLKHGPRATRYYAVLFAIGLSNEQVGKVMDVDLETVEAFREDARVVDTILEIQAAAGMSPQKRIAAATQSAIDVKLRLLRSKDEKIQSAVATELLDRDLGKPVQTTQSFNTNTNINASASEVDTRLAQMQERLKSLEAKKQLLLKA